MFRFVKTAFSEQIEHKHSTRRKKNATILKKCIPIRFYLIVAHFLALMKQFSGETLSRPHVLNGL